MANANSCAQTSLNEFAKRYKEILLIDGVSGLRKELNARGKIWKSTKVKIAITGKSGSGKSTFINSLLNLNEETAEDGIVETTEVTKSFCSPVCPNVILFDLPGVGTTKFPQETFFKDCELDKYDFYIIVARNRFYETDSWLAKEIKKRGKRFYFVRTHLEEDIDDNKKSHPSTHQDADVIQRIRTDCEENLEEFKKYVFLIDSFEREHHDFPKLVETLVQESKGMQASLLATSLAPVTQEVLDIKLISVLMRLITDVALRFLSGNLSPEERKKLIQDEIEYYRKVFDVDGTKLKNETLFNLSDTDLKKYTKELDDGNERMIHMFDEMAKPIIESFKGSLGDVLTSSAPTIYLLIKILKRFYVVASKLFEILPVTFAEECTKENTLKEIEFDVD